jgi:catechol 2,3-dioxygenase-like lactoylglutathione lyase family enzyme
MPRARALDHIVLDVADARRSLAWYTDRLGLVPERLDEWERGEAPFVSLRIDGHTIIDLLETERSGENMNHVCLVVDPDTDLGAIADSDEWDVAVPVSTVWGARGWGTSVYVRDPDGNTVELRVYRDG